MKTIDQYTDEEVAALSYEDVEKLKNLALATAGVKIPVEPVSPKLEDIVEPDTSVWVAAGTGMEYISKEAAEAVASALVGQSSALCKVSYDYHLGYDTKYHYIKDADRYAAESMGTVQEKRVYSRELYKQILDTAKSNKVLTDAYKAQKDEYKDQLAEAQDIIAAVDERVAQVEERFYKLRNLLERFKEYVVIADNDVTQAEKFFKAAYSPSDEDLAWVKSKHKEQSAKPSH